MRGFDIGRITDGRWTKKYDAMETTLNKTYGQTSVER